jgi:hypothetical protein
MAVTINAPFQKRLRRIVRRHNRLVHGVRHKVTSDGLIVAKPRIYTPRFPLKGMLIMVAVAFLFKGYIYADLGAQNYSDRVVTLSTGNYVEQAGAWMMYADPATKFVGNALSDILR